MTVFHTIVALKFNLFIVIHKCNKENVSIQIHYKICIVIGSRKDCSIGPWAIGIWSGRALIFVIVIYLDVKSLSCYHDLFRCKDFTW